MADILNVLDVLGQDLTRGTRQYAGMLDKVRPAPQPKPVVTEPLVGPQSKVDAVLRGLGLMAQDAWQGVDEAAHQIGRIVGGHAPLPTTTTQVTTPAPTSVPSSSQATPDNPFKPGPGISGGSTATATTFGRTPDWLAASQDPVVAEAQSVPSNQPSTQVEDLLSQLRTTSQVVPEPLKEGGWQGLVGEVLNALGSPQPLDAIGNINIDKDNQEIARRNALAQREADLQRIGTELDIRMKQATNQIDRDRLAAEIEANKTRREEVRNEKEELRRRWEKQDKRADENQAFTFGAPQRALEAEQRKAVNDIFGSTLNQTKNQTARKDFREATDDWLYKFTDGAYGQSKQDKRVSIFEKLVQDYSDQGIPIQEVIKRFPNMAKQLGN